ncbi:MAG TPA: hypothetical protein VGP41_13105 [Candidatus Lustribacter sp.]|jgi:hypothetical protein|nr:hypothetical protein [Candidatus Lustribacter sp.]
MEFVEFWRVRRSLLWFAGSVAAIVVLFLMLPQVGTVHVNGPGVSSSFPPGTGVPLGTLASLAAFFAAIYASIVGTSLNRENSTRELSWTKPLTRTLLALRYVLIDLAGVAIAFAIAVAAGAAIATYMHFPPYVDAEAPVQIVLGIGVGAMWYGLLQVLTCVAPAGARSLGGILWPVAFVVAGLSQVPGSIGAIMRAIDVLNPLHYMSSASSHGTTMSMGPAELPADERALIAWCFAVAFCAIAIALWPRKEA